MNLYVWNTDAGSMMLHYTKYLCVCCEGYVLAFVCLASKQDYLKRCV